MNKKQLIAVWIVAVLFFVVLGLKTTTVYKLSEISKPGGPSLGNTALMLYGSQLLTSENAGPFHFLLQFGDYKYHFIIFLLVLVLLLTYTFKQNKRT